MARAGDQRTDRAPRSSKRAPHARARHRMGTKRCIDHAPVARGTLSNAVKEGRHETHARLPMDRVGIGGPTRQKAEPHEAATGHTRPQGQSPNLRDRAQAGVAQSGHATPRRGPGAGTTPRPDRTRTNAGATRTNAASQGTHHQQGKGIGGPRPGGAQARRTAVGPVVRAQSSTRARDVAPRTANVKLHLHQRGRETAVAPLGDMPSVARRRRTRTRTRTVAQGKEEEREGQPYWDQVTAGKEASLGMRVASRTAAKRTVRRSPPNDHGPELNPKETVSQTMQLRLNTQGAAR